MRVYAITEVEKLNECREYFKYINERDLVMFEIGLKTLLRISDILELRVKDVKGKTVIRKKLVKTKRDVNIPIRTDLKKILDKYCEDKPNNEYLIKSRNGINKPISRVQAYRVLNDMAKYLGMERIGTHSLRKTGAYHIYKTTNDIDLVRRLLGHKSKEEVYEYI
ncbi:MAG: tyrosine-type recombinase/integrase, partial [Clostridium sp.]